MVANTNKGTKRPSTGVESQKKKEKKSPYSSMLEGISTALGGMENMHPDARDMLVAMVDGSLNTAKDERHKYQDTAVKMIGDALEKIQADMVQNIAAENEKLVEKEEKKAELDKARDQAAERLAAKVASSKGRKAELVQVSMALQKAKAAFAEVQDAQRKGDASQVAAVKECKSFDEVFEESFVPLKAGEWEDSADATKHLDALTPFVEKIDLEESLLTSLRAAGTKKAAERGAFDSMVLEELEKNLTAKLQSLRETVAEGAPAAAERAAAVQAAQTSFDEAKGKVQESATALNAAQAEEHEHEAELKKTEEAVKEFGPTFRKATEARDFIQNNLQDFENWPLASYTTLRDRIAEKAAAEESAEAAAEVAEEVETC